MLISLKDPSNSARHLQPTGSHHPHPCKFSLLERPRLQPQWSPPSNSLSALIGTRGKEKRDGRRQNLGGPRKKFEKSSPKTPHRRDIFRGFSIHPESPVAFSQNVSIYSCYKGDERRGVACRPRSGSFRVHSGTKRKFANNLVQTLKASKALIAHIKKAAATPAASGKQNLLADEESTVAETPIWLTLTTKKHIHDTHRLQPSKIILPHPLNTDSEATICLITADPQRHYKNVVASEEFPEELRTRITRVIDVSHIKTKFKAYEAQRKLFSEHEIFLADERIINRLPKALGKTFFKSTVKRPIPVVLMAQRERVDGKRIARPKGKKLKRDPVENVNARPTAEIAAEIQKAIGAALVSVCFTPFAGVQVNVLIPPETSANQLIS